MSECRAARSGKRRTPGHRRRAVAVVGCGRSGLNVRRCIVFGALLLASAGVISAEPGSAYPSKPIHYIVPFAPGGPTDIMSRAIGEKVGAAWGQQVVVDNRGGAGGNIGAETVAK